MVSHQTIDKSVPPFLPPDSYAFSLFILCFVFFFSNTITPCTDNARHQGILHGYLNLSSATLSFIVVRANQVGWFGGCFCPPNIHVCCQICQRRHHCRTWHNLLSLLFFSFVSMMKRIRMVYNEICGYTWNVKLSVWLIVIRGNYWKISLHFKTKSIVVKEGYCL